MQEIWVQVTKANTWLFATHLPEMQNFKTELESRKGEVYTEGKIKH